MPKERIHILVDRSRDSSWSDALIEIEPDDIYKITDNRDLLCWTILKDYDVLTICGYPIVEYNEYELRDIEKFVRLGGGVLLASSSSKFARDVGKPISEMQLNKIAQIFDSQFLSLDDCKGELKTDDDLTCGYTSDSFWLADRAIFADLESYEIPFSNCGIISHPENADVIIKHNETMESIAACIGYGEGRVLIINDATFAQNSQRVCRAFIDWLTRNRFPEDSGEETIPDEIPVEEYAIEDDKIKIIHNQFVSKERGDTCLNYAKAIYQHLSDLFPDEIKQTWRIELNPSCTYEPSKHRQVNIGAYMSDHKLASALMFNAMTRIGILRDLAFNVFCREAFIQYSAIMGMRLLGFEQEADDMYFEILRQLKKKDPSGAKFDISKYYSFHIKVSRRYDYHPKLAWVLISLADKYGNDIFARMSKNIPELKDLWIDTPSYIPRQVFSKMDTFIHYLSLATGEDMTSWFRSIGTDVHPLPVYKDKTNDFGDGVIQYLKERIRDSSLDISEREDAIYGLIYIYDKTGRQDFDDGGKYDPIVYALMLAKSCDARAKDTLGKLAFDEDTGISAIACLELAKLGDVLVLRRLTDMAESADCRFRLKISRVIGNLGEKIPIEIQYDGVRLRVYPTIGSERVGNVFSLVDGFYHFPENTHVTNIHIDWVRTLYKYRRIGISSETMRQTLLHPSVRRCSCATLNTGVGNPAHAMYKGFGFVDKSLFEVFYMELKPENLDIPDGFVIRSYSPGDESKMAELANRFYADLISIGRVRAKRYRNDENIIKIAEKDGEMLGFVTASISSGDNEASLKHICLNDMNDFDAIGSSLLRSLHQELVALGFKRMLFWHPLSEKEDVRRALNQIGYCPKFLGGVEMIKIINLPMLLEEITPLLMKRLANGDYRDWQGKIGISGENHKATIIIENGEISIVEEILDNSNIMLKANDETITRMIIRKANPFEAYLQGNLTVKPLANDKVFGLLKQLFPKMPS